MDRRARGRLVGVTRLALARRQSRWPEIVDETVHVRDSSSFDPQEVPTFGERFDVPIKGLAFNPAPLHVWPQGKALGPRPDRASPCGQTCRGVGLQSQTPIRSIGLRIQTACTGLSISSRSPASPRGWALPSTSSEVPVPWYWRATLEFDLFSNGHF